MLVTGSGQTPEVIVTDPGMMWIFSGSRSHSSWVRVMSSSCSELVRARCPSWLERPGQAALVLHVMQQLGGAVRVGGDDHLLGGVGVMVHVPGALCPAGMTRVHLEPASVERHEVVHFVQSWTSAPSFSAR